MSASLRLLKFDRRMTKPRYVSDGSTMYPSGGVSL
jgi:hypothetical protein